MLPYQNYIDLHCDTAYELFRTGALLSQNDLHISLHRAAPYEHWAQCFAVWSAQGRTDEQAFEDFIAITDYFQAQLEAEQDCISFVRTADELNHARACGRHAAILAVEDARLLNGQLARLDTLAARGVFYLTLLWGGVTCIGGSHDTDIGLSDFGRQVVRGCFEIGIVPDISHASKQSAEQILAMAEEAKRPVIASHSNAYAVYPHSRNLRDAHFLRLIDLGGVVGINLCAHHLRNCAERHAEPTDVLRHVDHFLSLGGECHVALGGDMDGAPMPRGIDALDSMVLLAECMAKHGYNDELIHRIFYQNAYEFMKKHLGQHRREKIDHDSERI